MNITEFRKNVLTLNLNKAEQLRIENLTSRSFKYRVRLLGFDNITEANFKNVWSKLNQDLAKQDKFHRIQTNSMRNYKGFVDYSHLSYNGCTDDF